MKQWGMWHYRKNKCILPFFSKKWSQKVILCTIFHKFDLFFLFDFNITKMHIFCNFFKRRLLLSQTKNDFYWQMHTTWRHQEDDLDRKCILITQYLDTKGIYKFHIDEKLGIRFRKWKNAKLFIFCIFFRKEVKKLFNAGFDRIWTLYTFRRLRYWFSIFVAIKTIFTQQPNLEISWMICKHNLNIQQWLTRWNFSVAMVIKSA